MLRVQRLGMVHRVDVGRGGEVEQHLMGYGRVKGGIWTLCWGGGGVTRTHSSKMETSS